MSQHDYIISNQDGASFRGDLNAALQAGATLNSGATAPATTYAYMLWHDTTAGILKQRNAGNSAWVNLIDVLLPNQLTRATSQATTSGTSKDFTGIPSWANKITAMLNGVSVGSGSDLLLQVGSGSVATSGYTSSASLVSAGAATSGSTAGIILTSTLTASEAYTGAVTLFRMTGNTWVASGTFARTNNTGVTLCGGSIALGGALDRLRLTTVGGSAAFDAGSVNILYE